MPRGTEHSNEERFLIKEMGHAGMKIGEIASAVNRHRNTIANILENP